MPYAVFPAIRVTYFDDAPISDVVRMFADMVILYTSHLAFTRDMLRDARNGYCRITTIIIAVAQPTLCFCNAWRPGLLGPTCSDTRVICSAMGGAWCDLRNALPLPDVAPMN